MKLKLIFLCFNVFIVSFTNAQDGKASKTYSIRNTAWKFYLQEPINDTTIWRFANDSSLIETKKGENLVYGLFSMAHDTLTFHDEGGLYHCPSFQIAQYKIVIKDDWLTLDLIDDDCIGRSAIINGAKLKRFK